jgi:UDP:flavonoid glycosyltransferase YjiC (YdhE family)
MALDVAEGELAPTAGRYVIITWPGGGNVPPALALGRWLTRAGHQVSVLAPEPTGAAASAAGLPFTPCRSVPPWPEGCAFEDDLRGFAAMRDGPDLAAEVRDVLEQQQPDIVVVDCMMTAGLAAAECAGLPTAALVHVLYQPYVNGWGPLFVDPAPARAALGLAPADPPGPLGAIRTAALTLALTPAALDLPGPQPPSYVGPIFDPEPVVVADNLEGWRVDPRPRVLITFGTTTQSQANALPPVLEAVGGLNVRGLLTMGGVPLTRPVRAPSNVVVRDRVPHAALFPHASVVVSHGGLSTVMGALAHGVPLVCLPQGREQGLNAERVEATGAGLQLPAGASPAEIAEAVTEVVNNPAYRAAAQSFGDSIDAGDGARRAVEQLEALRRAPFHAGRA